MNLFIDTSGFLAVLNQNDRFHLPAKEAWLDILGDDSVLFSSNYVLLEMTALLQHRFGVNALRLFHNTIHPILHIIWVNQEVHDLAMGVLLSLNRRQLSLVDCTSFQIMRAANLEHAFTFDGHFSEQGFTVTPKLN
jgi:predicted nucleic acid-binding protein